MEEIAREYTVRIAQFLPDNLIPVVVQYVTPKRGYVWFKHHEDPAELFHVDFGSDFVQDVYKYDNEYITSLERPASMARYWYTVRQEDDGTVIGRIHFPTCTNRSWGNLFAKYVLQKGYDMLCLMRIQKNITYREL